ncbi:hypothetical protein EB796_003170 [Bugula neritina]|uniref:Uncharacterized protein n=1 Tax=Bugula neritina TaxID=10212 RepID=A0A7J7KJS2_BUGNE|nr:hypothetical protein EB796_003170 [Bugula neritina]
MFGLDEKDRLERRLSAFSSSTSAVQQLLTLGEYKSFAEEFASKGTMHDKLFKHLLRTETDFQENPAMRVAAKILLSFKIMYQSKMQNEESSFIVPYFCKEFLSDSLPNTGSCVTLHAQLRFDGLPLPQYAYHQLAVDMLNSFSQDSDSITARNNGARVMNEDVTYQLVHDYKSGIVNICVSFDSRQVCKAWKVLVDVTNFAIEYVETRWCACKIGCKFFCAHCGLEKDHHPSSLMNPFWVQHHDKRWMSFLPSFFDNQLKSQQLNDYKGFNADLDFFKYRGLFSSQRHHNVNWIADSADGKIFRCKKDSSTPSCLLNPCSSLSEEESKCLSSYLSKYQKTNSTGTAYETQVESDDEKADADSDISEHEDFSSPQEAGNIKMEVSGTKKEKIKRLFYSNEVL